VSSYDALSTLLKICISYHLRLISRLSARFSRVKMHDTPLPKLLYRPAEAADAIGISRAKLYALVAAGVIPSVRVGQSIRVPVKALVGGTT
jgi:excisionase family DNA binding protein